MVGHNSNKQLNRAFSLYDWQDRLEASDLSKEEKWSYAITIRWYLSFCKSNQVRTTYATAKAFLKQVKTAKEPAGTVYQKWRLALRWFFLEA